MFWIWPVLIQMRSPSVLYEPDTGYRCAERRREATEFCIAHDMDYKVESVFWQDRLHTYSDMLMCVPCFCKQ